MKYNLIENPGDELAIGVFEDGNKDEAPAVAPEAPVTKPGFLQILAWGVITNDLIGYVVHGSIDYILIIYPISYVFIPFYNIYNLTVLLYFISAYRLLSVKSFINFILTLPYVMTQLRSFYSES